MIAPRLLIAKIEEHKHHLSLSEFYSKAFNISANNNNVLYTKNIGKILFLEIGQNYSEPKYIKKSYMDAANKNNSDDSIKKYAINFSASVKLNDTFLIKPFVTLGYSKLKQNLNTINNRIITRNNLNQDNNNTNWFSFAGMSMILFLNENSGAQVGARFGKESKYKSPYHYRQDDFDDNTKISLSFFSSL